MSNSIYAALSRQVSLLRELSAVAENVANISTDGYRRERIVFSEYVEALEGPAGSLSMARAHARFLDTSQGVLTATGSTLDVAIEGDGYFLVETPRGDRLTRNGSFTTTPEGVLVTSFGDPVLSDAGGRIILPPDVSQVAIAADGTISFDGVPADRLGVVTVADPEALRRETGALFIADQPIAPAEDARVAQGFLESSNVNAVEEISRLIEVQRAYELGANLLEREDGRIMKAVQTLGRPV